MINLLLLLKKGLYNILTLKSKKKNKTHKKAQVGLAPREKIAP